jgi:hypothetical protein
MREMGREDRVAWIGLERLSRSMGKGMLGQARPVMECCQVSAQKALEESENPFLFQIFL